MSIKPVIRLRVVLLDVVDVRNTGAPVVFNIPPPFVVYRGKTVLTL